VIPRYLEVFFWRRRMIPIIPTYAGVPGFPPPLKGDIDYFSKGPKSSRTDRTPKKEVIPSKLDFKYLPL
jgi:hypothetical protein